MTSTERNRAELVEWGSQEKRSPLPSHLLPSPDDMQALLYRETPAMNYFLQFFSDLVEVQCDTIEKMNSMAEKMNGMAEEVKQLRKLVEGKA